MTEKELQKELEAELTESFENIPDGIWDENPRYQITGEIIPEELHRHGSGDQAKQTGGAETGKSRNP